MKQLPQSPDLSHLKKQAKDLLRAFQQSDPSAIARFRVSLPSAAGLSPAQLAAQPLRLHDAQSLIAREYGFASWGELKTYVDWKSAGQKTTAADRERWVNLVYEGNSRERTLAARLLRENAGLAQGDPYLACAIGGLAALQQQTQLDPSWVNRPGGPLNMPPLVAVTHSRLASHPTFAAALERAARFLLDHAADPNQSWIHKDFPDSPLSALYGAAGKNHHAGMTRLLLEHGATPNDNESLYHSVENPDDTCTRILLAAHATVAGTNAVNRVLDFDKLDLLKLLLAHDRDPARNLNHGRSLHHAILRGRSTAHIQALLEAGADPSNPNKDGLSAGQYALLNGREDLAALFMPSDDNEDLSVIDRFVVACACGHGDAARSMLAKDPTLVSQLSEKQRRLLPELAEVGNLAGVRTMLECGWPIETHAGWDASALNLAVFHGNAEMARLLLAHGANWAEPHGYGGNAMGTLSYASLAEDIDHSHGGDYLGCARALIEHGMPVPPETFEYSSEVEEYFQSPRETPSSPE
jgi:ankyrin repeat protein